MTAIDAGCYALLIEKPMTLNAGESEEIVHAARIMGVRAAVGHNYRFHGGIQQMIQSVDDIGLHVLQIAAVDNVSKWPGYNDGQGYMMKNDSGGILLTSGSHAVDLAIFMGGPVASLTCAARKDKTGLDVEMLLRLVHSGGVVSAIFNRWDDTDEYSTVSMVTNTKASFVDLKAFDKELVAMHSKMMNAFIEYANDGPGDFLCRADEGHAVMSVLDAARENWDSAKGIKLIGGIDSE
jgi:predicted dehydrogenase